MMRSGTTGERGEAFDAERDQVEARPFALAGDAVDGRIRHGLLAKSGPGIEALVETALVAQLRQRVGDRPPHDAKIAGVFGDIEPLGPVDQLVEQTRELRAPPAILAAIRAHGVHDIDVGPFDEPADHRQRRLQRMLQIGIHQHDIVAGRLVDTGEQRDFLAEIAAELDDLPVSGERFGEFRNAGIRAAVVDQDGFERQPEARLGLLAEFRQKLSEMRRRVETRCRMALRHSVSPRLSLYHLHFLRCDASNPRTAKILPGRTL